MSVFVRIGRVVGQGDSSPEQLPWRAGLRGQLLEVVVQWMEG